MPSLSLRSLYDEEVRRAARILSFLGALVVVLGLSKVHAAYVADPPYDFTGSFRFAWALSYVLLLSIGSYGVGLPDLPRSSKDAFVGAMGSAVIAGVAISVVQLVVGNALLPRFVVFGSVVLLVPWNVALAALARTGRARDADRDRVVLVGSSEDLDRLLNDLKLEPEKAASLVGHLSPDEASSPAGTHPLEDLAVSRNASVVVLDRVSLAMDSVVDQAAVLHESGIRVRTLVQFYEEWLGKLPVSELERASLFFDISEIHRARYGRVKRLMDVAIGMVGLVPLLLVVPLVTIGNLIGNRGMLIYRQPRVGRGGEAFSILKFRTMREVSSSDAEIAEGSWTAVDDPRVTPFGKFMRATHIDELPQMINIVKGELSLVGPRPEQPRYVAELTETLPFYSMRHLVRPGLTGWAQVKYGYAGDQQDALEKLQYEFFYLRNQSLRFDTRVMARTARSVLGSEGAGR